MKSKIIERETDEYFEPITIELTIESKYELANLYARACKLVLGLKGVGQDQVSFEDVQAGEDANDPLYLTLRGILLKRAK